MSRGPRTPEERFRQLRGAYRSAHRDLRAYISDHYEDRDSHGKAATDVILSTDEEGQRLLRRRNELREKAIGAAAEAGEVWP